MGMVTKKNSEKVMTRLFSSKLIDEKLEHVKTVLNIFTAAWGTTTIAKAFGKALSLPKKSSKTMFDIIAGPEKFVRAPDSDTYDRYKKKCHSKGRLSCTTLYRNDCRWNNHKKKCIVRDRIKYMFKVANSKHDNKLPIPAPVDMNESAEKKERKEENEG